MEDWMEGWKIGRVEDWKGGRLEGWKIGRVEDWKGGRLEDWKEGRMDGRLEGRLEDWKEFLRMATVFIDADKIYPARDTADKKTDGDRRSIEELSGGTPILTVALGATAQTVNCVWFGVENVAKAEISLDSSVVVFAEAYPKKKGFASFNEQGVTEVSLAVTEKEDMSLPVVVSEVIAGKVLLELPDKVFLPNTAPQSALRGAGVHEMLGGSLRPWGTVNNEKAKLDISYIGSRWKKDRVEAFMNVYENYRTFYFVRDTLSHPLDGYLAVFDNVTLPVPYSTGYRPAGQDVEFSVREM